MITKSSKQGQEVEFDDEEWANELATEPHTIRGRTPCRICSTVTDFVYTGLVKDRRKPPIICDSCKTNIAQGGSIS